jgi:hypothetical protein
MKTRSLKLAVLAGALAVLTVGPGCGVFDDMWDDGGYTASYQRDGAQPVRSTGTGTGAGVQQPAEVSTGAAARQPGVYPAAK